MAAGLDNLGQNMGQYASMFSGAIKIFFIIMAVFIVGVAAFMVVYFFFRPMLFKIVCHVYAKRHGDFFSIGHDKARIKKVRAKFFGLLGPVVATKLVLFSRKVEIPVPDLEFLYPTDKKNSTGLLNLYKYGELDYTPCHIKINSDGISLVPIESDILAWHLQSNEAVDRRNPTKNLLEKYQVVIAAGMVCVMVCGSMYFAYKYNQMAFSEYGKQMGNVAETLKSLYMNTKGLN
jgi:hypothetical protein